MKGKKKVTLIASLIGATFIVVLLFVRSPIFFNDDNTKLNSKFELKCSKNPHSKKLLKNFVIIGHRGNSSVAPENTLEAIHQAFAAGAGMVEVDLQLSREGVPIIIHDLTVDRTTNGKGYVSKKTLPQLKSLDAGSWKDPKYAGERVPTLAEALQAAKGNGRLLLDLKVDGTGAAVAKVLKSLNLPDNIVAVGTQTPEQTQDYVIHVPGAEILYNFEAPSQWEQDVFKKQLARGIKGFELGANWSPEFISAAHAHGMPVYAYVINDEPTMRKLIEMGINGIETDFPERLAKVIKDICNQR